MDKKTPPKPQIQSVEFVVGGKKLAGTLYEVGKNIPGVLILGGGAHLPHRESYYPSLQLELSRIGFNSLAFDHRGVGLSEGDESDRGLNNRLADARAATEILKRSSKRVYIFGVSLGGPVAIRLGNEIHAEGLILIAPAAYSAEARTVKSREEFSKAIKKPNSWVGSPDFDDLRKFDGQVLLAYGSQDEVIPQAILQEYSQIVEEKGGKVLVFEGVGHRFMRLDDTAGIQIKTELYAAIAELI